MNEAKLIELAQGGSKEAFSALVKNYSKKLYQFLFLKCQNDADIEDVLQETFVRAYQKIHLYQSSYSFSTWLYTLACHEFARHSSKKKKNTFEPMSETEAKKKQDFLEDAENAKNLWLLASKLGDRPYTALWLYYKEEKTYQEIAQIMGVSVVRLKLILFRGKGAMKKMLEAEEKMSVVKNQNSLLFGAKI